jgi:drug/metabolite transporter (DMT)-like permease
MNFLGAAFALLSAVTWGSGDFTGGYASRRHSQYQVLTLSALSGALVLVLLALLRGETLPSPTSFRHRCLLPCPGDRTGSSGRAHRCGADCRHPGKL